MRSGAYPFSIPNHYCVGSFFPPSKRLSHMVNAAGRFVSFYDETRSIFLFYKQRMMSFRSFCLSDIECENIIVHKLRNC